MSAPLAADAGEQVAVMDGEHGLSAGVSAVFVLLVAEETARK